MKFRNRILRGAGILGLGQALGNVCSFVRLIVILPIFLTKADFGVAASFLLTVAMFEMLSNLAVDRLLVQDADGNDPDFQAMAQFIVAVRGLINGAIIFALAWPIAWLLDVPHARWAFHCLGVIPVLKGLGHLDVIRYQREMRYTSMVVVEVIVQLLMTLACWPLAYWLRDYSVMLWLLIAKWAIGAVGNHLVAERPYRWAWHPRYVSRILVFGWPLLVNGLLLFGVFQGDKLIVAPLYDIDDFGVYSWAAALAMQPGLMFIKVISPIMLPLLSRAQNTSAEFIKRYSMCTQTLSLISACFAVAFILAAGPYIAVFCKKFTACGAFIGWLAAIQAFRIMRAGPTMAAMAKGDTKNLMVSNIVRVSGLGLAIWAGVRGGGDVRTLKWIAIAGFSGEILAGLVSVIRLSIRQQLPLGVAFRPAALSAGVIGLAALLAVKGEALGLLTVTGEASGLAAVTAWTFALMALSFAGSVLLFRNFREQLLKTLRGLPEALRRPDSPPPAADEKS